MGQLSILFGHASIRSIVCRATVVRSATKIDYLLQMLGFHPLPVCMFFTHLSYMHTVDMPSRCPCYILQSCVSTALYPVRVSYIMPVVRGLELAGRWVWRFAGSGGPKTCALLELCSHKEERGGFKCCLVHSLAVLFSGLFCADFSFVLRIHTWLWFRFGQLLSFLCKLGVIAPQEARFSSIETDTGKESPSLGRWLRRRVISAPVLAASSVGSQIFDFCNLKIHLSISRRHL